MTHLSIYSNPPLLVLALCFFQANFRGYGRYEKCNNSVGVYTVLPVDDISFLKDCHMPTFHRFKVPTVGRGAWEGKS